MPPSDKKSVSIRMPIEPVAFARAGSNNGRRFTPRKQADFMGELRLFADREMAGRELFDGPCVLAATFTYLHPASWSEKKKAAVIHKTSKPDLDNLLKLCKDALNGCVYTDDALIVSILATKCYGSKPELALTISQIDEPWRRS